MSDTVRVIRSKAKSKYTLASESREKGMPSETHTMEIFIADLYKRGGVLGGD